MSSRLHNLQALRGAACLLVLVYHLAAFELATETSAHRHILHPVTFFGFAGVDLFFVLSGFVITWVHADDKRADTDPDLLIEILFGPLQLRAVKGQTLSRRDAEDIVDVVLRGCGTRKRAGG